jgi:hypothetical protein
MFSQPKVLLSKNGLRIDVGRLVKMLGKYFETNKKKCVLSKNDLRIAIGRLFKLLEKIF